MGYAEAQLIKIADQLADGTKGREHWKKIHNLKISRIFVLLHNLTDATQSLEMLRAAEVPWATIPSNPM